MAFLFQQIKGIKIHVFRWISAGVLQENLSAGCGVFQCRVINHTMNLPKKQEVQSNNGEFKKALKPFFYDLPCPSSSGELCHSWADIFYHIFSHDEIFFHESAEYLAETIAGYLQSNFRVSKETLFGENGCRIVVTVDVEMVTLYWGCQDKGIGFDSRVCLNVRMLDDPVVSGGGGGDEEAKEVLHYILTQLLKEGADVICLPEEEDTPAREAAFEFEEIKPPLKMKRYEAAPPQLSDESSGERCPISLQEFQEGDRVVVTPCSHVFHERPLLRWLSKNQSCPLCRSTCYVCI